MKIEPIGLMLLMTEYARIGQVYPAAQIQNTIRSGRDNWTVATRDHADGPQVHLIKEEDAHGKSLAYCELKEKELELAAMKRAGLDTDSMQKCVDCLREIASEDTTTEWVFPADVQKLTFWIER